MQEKLIKERKISVVVKALAKNSLAFYGYNEKIYQENNAREFF